MSSEAADLRTQPPPLSATEQADISEALVERSSIIEFEAGATRHEADAQARSAMRVYRILVSMPKGDPRPPRWITMLAPGTDLSEARRSARARFGTERVLNVVEVNR